MTTELTVPPPAEPTAEEMAASVAAGLRAAADMVEANPDLRVAYHTWSMWCASDRDELAAIARAALRAGASVEKRSAEGIFRLDLRFGPLTIHALSYLGEVCERVVVGTREITETVPDPDHEIPMVERTRTEDVIEWRCPPSLLSAADPSVTDPGRTTP